MKQIFNSFQRFLIAFDLRVAVWFQIIIGLLCGVMVLGILFDKQSFLMNNLDSVYLRSLMQQELEWRGGGTSFPGCPFEAMYSLWHGRNPNLSLSTFFASLITTVGSQDHVVALFAFNALEICGGIMLLAKIARIPFSISWGISILATLFIFPCATYSIYPITRTNLFIMEAVALAFFFVYTLELFAKAKTVTSAVLTATLCAGTFLLFASYDPLRLALALPMMAIFGLAILWSSGVKRYILFGSIFLPPFSLAIIVIKGFKDYSQPGFFAHELANDRATWEFVSIAFQGGVGPWIVFLGILGALVGAWFGHSTERRLFVAIVAYALGLLTLGSIVQFMPDYRGPSMLYFEFVAWPLYFLGIAGLLRAIKHFLSLHLPYGAATVFQFSIQVALLIFCISLLRVAKSDPLLSYSWGAWPPKETSIIRSLKADLKLKFGTQFRGYAYTQTNITPNANNSNIIPWMAIYEKEHDWANKFGNDHRSSGLIYHGIPTYFQYGSVMTPRYHFANARIMGKGVPQIRVVVVASELNASFLRMAGVAKVISNSLLPMPFYQDNPQEVFNDETNIRLFSLKDVNLGNYSPTTLHIIDDAMDLVNACLKGGVDFQKEAFIERPITTPLIPVVSSEFSFLQGGIHVVAHSSGTSLLVLPIEYSHCMQAKAIRGEPVSIFPVNIIATGLLFKGDVEVAITKEFGVFKHPFSLLEDAADFRRILKR